MKWLIFLVLLAIFLPLGAQLRTRYTPLPSAHRAWVWGVRTRVWGVAVVRFV